MDFIVNLIKKMELETFVYGDPIITYGNPPFSSILHLKVKWGINFLSC